MKSKQTQCGDWHLGWGLSGNDKIGKLSTENGVTFTWKGYSQGRHGQKWNKGARLEFHLDEKGKIVATDQVGRVPRHSEIYRSIEELKLKT